jgi:hypothetical protein
MARPEVTGRRIAPVQRAAYSIREFCEAHRLSESMYYKLREAGLGPREARALKKVIITFEAAADWRREREIAGGEAA